MSYHFLSFSEDLASSKTCLSVSLARLCARVELVWKLTPVSDSRFELRVLLLSNGLTMSDVGAQPRFVNIKYPYNRTLSCCYASYCRSLFMLHLLSDQCEGIPSSRAIAPLYHYSRSLAELWDCVSSWPSFSILA